MAGKQRTQQVVKPIPLMVRLPPGLHETVKDSAEQSYRSLNAQIISLIELGLQCRQPETTHRPERVP